MRRRNGASLCIAVVGVAAAVFTVACQAKTVRATRYTSSSDTPTISQLGDTVRVSAGNFFTPNYTPALPEEAAESERVSARSREPSGRSESTSVVPGLRELSRYQTSYHPEITTSASAPALQQPAVQGGVTTSTEPFTVVDWGPQDEVPAAVWRPSFYVLFS